jgi:D-glycero-D-manno-heptose 1,7-bisphosphate phosphatase
MSIKTIFLDRDGVINKEINYLHKIDDFEFIDGVFEAFFNILFFFEDPNTPRINMWI